MHTLLIVLLWVAAAWLAFGTLATVSLVGKRRDPITPGSAAFTVATAAVVIGTIVAAAISLSNTAAS